MMTFSIAGSRVMINTNLEQFLSRFLVGNYILSPETITRKVAIFQTQQQIPLLPLPEININLSRKICVTHDQLRTRVFPPQEGRAWERG